MLIPLVTLIVFFVFSTLAFGAVEHWSTAVCEGLLFTGAAVAAWRRKDFLSFPATLAAPFLAAVFLAGVAVLQIVPLPVSYWGWIGDERATSRSDGFKSEELLRSDAYRTEPFSGRTLPVDKLPFQTPPPSPWVPTSFLPSATLARPLGSLGRGFLYPPSGVAWETDIRLARPGLGQRAPWPPGRANRRGPVQARRDQGARSPGECERAHRLRALHQRKQRNGVRQHHLLPPLLSCVAEDPQEHLGQR